MKISKELHKLKMIQRRNKYRQENNRPFVPPVFRPLKNLREKARRLIQIKAGQIPVDQMINV